MTYIVNINYLLRLIILLTLISNNSIAHTTNEETLFPDIKSLDARFDIILLVGVGIIPETENFWPNKPMTLVDLAAWVGLSEGLVEIKDSLDIDLLAHSALKAGIAESLDGQANLSDVNKMIFQGRLLPTNEKAVLNRVDAAVYIAENITNIIEGDSWLQQKNMRVGPSGEVTKVESKINPDGSSLFFVTVAGETHPVFSHGKLANGPTDLHQWKGRLIRRSIIRDLGSMELWVFLEAYD